MVRPEAEEMLMIEVIEEHSNEGLCVSLESLPHPGPSHTQEGTHTILILRRWRQ